MSHALPGGVPRVWRDHRGPLGRAYRGHFLGLRERFGPLAGAVRDYAAATAALWAEWRSASEALAEAQRHRREGRGRRPSTAQIARLQRRAGLAWTSYDGALRRLEELAGRNGANLDLARAIAQARAQQEKS